MLKAVEADQTKFVADLTGTSGPPKRGETPYKTSTVKQRIHQIVCEHGSETDKDKWADLLVKVVEGATKASDVLNGPLKWLTELDGVTVADDDEDDTEEVERPLTGVSSNGASAN